MAGYDYGGGYSSGYDSSLGNRGYGTGRMPGSSGLSGPHGMMGGGNDIMGSGSAMGGGGSRMGGSNSYMGGGYGNMGEMGPGTMMGGGDPNESNAKQQLEEMKAEMAAMKKKMIELQSKTEMGGGNVFPKGMGGGSMMGGVGDEGLSGFRGGGFGGPSSGGSRMGRGGASADFDYVGGGGDPLESASSVAALKALLPSGGQRHTSLTSMAATGGPGIGAGRPMVRPSMGPRPMGPSMDGPQPLMGMGGPRPPMGGPHPPMGPRPPMGPTNALMMAAGGKRQFDERPNWYGIEEGGEEYDDGDEYFDAGRTRWDIMMEEQAMEREQQLQDEIARAKGEEKKKEAANLKTSKKHQDVANEVEITVPSDMMLMNVCKLCDATFSGDDSAKLHYTGRRHAQKENQYVRKVYAEMGIDPTRFLQKPQGGLPPVEKQKKKKGIDTSKFKYTCFLCNVSFERYDQVEAHVLTLQHNDKVQRYQTGMPWGGSGMGGGGPPAPKKTKAAPTSSGDNDYYCLLCDKHMNSPQQYELHIDSKKHRNKEKEADFVLY